MFTTGTQDDTKVTRSDWIVKLITGSHNPINIRKQHRLYPSSAGLCARRNVLALTLEYEDTFNLSGLFYTTIGNSVHEVIQDGIVRRDPKALIEFVLKDETLNLSGRADVIMRDRETDKPFIMDIKTTGAIPRAPKKEHIRQLAVYAMLTGIYDTEIFYVSRNVGNPPKMKGYTIDFRTKQYAFVFNEVIQTIVHSIVAKRHGEMPPRQRYPSKCKYCPFYELCWDEPSDVALKTSYKEFDYEKYTDEILNLTQYVWDTMKIKYKEIGKIV